MKIDLDKLERKATAVVASRTLFELAQWGASQATDGRRWSDHQLRDAAWHVAANSPPVTLALVARIRELEARISRDADFDEAEAEQEPDDISRELLEGRVLSARALLEKGVTVDE